MADVSFQVSWWFVFKIIISHDFCFLNCRLEIVLFKKPSDNLAGIFRLEALFNWQFLEKPLFHQNNLIFQRYISCFSHVKCNNESFDEIVLSSKVFKRDGIKSIKDLVIFGRIWNNNFERRASQFLEYFVFAVPRERAGDWEVSLGIGRAYDKADGFSELVVL